jgi:hypothetical protein
VQFAILFIRAERRQGAVEFRDPMTIAPFQRTGLLLVFRVYLLSWNYSPQVILESFTLIYYCAKHTIQAGKIYYFTIRENPYDYQGFPYIRIGEKNSCIYYVFLYFGTVIVNIQSIR